MKNRLELSEELLNNDGAIFISINDDGLAYLKVLLDEIFKIENFIGVIPRLTSTQHPSQEKYFSINHDYLLVYAKNKKYTFNSIIERDYSQEVFEDSIGKFFKNDTSPILASSTQGYSKGGDYDVKFNGKVYKPIDFKGNRRRWLWNEERMNKAIELGIVVEMPTTLRVRNYINKESINKNVTKYGWYVMDHFAGNQLEEKLIEFIAERMGNLSRHYDFHLIRNEEVYKIHAFDNGEGFQPDFLLLLKSKYKTSIENISDSLHYQIFIEPKGEHLIEKDAWKTNFLAAITEKHGANNILKKETPHYRLIGLPFFREENEDNRLNDEFKLKFNELL